MGDGGTEVAVAGVAVGVAVAGVAVGVGVGVDDVEPNVAVTWVVVVIATEQDCVPLHAPLQPEKGVAPFAVTVSTIGVS